VTDDGAVDVLEEWFASISDRDRWFFKNFLIMVGVLAGYLLVASLVLWPIEGFLPDDVEARLSAAMGTAFYWLWTMVPLGLIVLAILWRGRERWSHPRAAAIMLSPISLSPWLVYFLAALDELPVLALLDVTVPAMLFGALLRLPPRRATGSGRRQSEVEATDWSL
jgi:hypothetical protein